MNYATRYTNAFNVALGDTKLEKIVESEFERVKLNQIKGIKTPRISLILFEDFSYVIGVDQIETFVDIDPREIANFLNRISAKFPEQVKEFLEILSDVAKKNLESAR